MQVEVGVEVNVAVDDERSVDEVDETLVHGMHRSHGGIWQTSLER